MTAQQIVVERQRRRFKKQLPRHLAGAALAAGLGVLAFAGALWATGPTAVTGIEAEPEAPLAQPVGVYTLRR